MGVYLDNVDYEELYRQALDKTIRQFIFNSMEYFAETGVNIEPKDYPFKQWEKYWCDWIWLMGPVPMKKGYVAPTFNMSDDLFKHLYPNGIPKIEPIYSEYDPDRPGYQDKVLEKLKGVI